MILEPTRERFDARLRKDTRYYTVVYFQGREKGYYKHKLKTMKGALTHARRLERPCMIYAVCGKQGGYLHTIHVTNVGTVDTGLEGL